MALCSSDKYGKEICDIFGIKNGISIDIYFETKTIPFVTVEFYPEEDQIRQLIPILKKYRLEEIEKKEENPMLKFGDK